MSLLEEDPYVGNHCESTTLVNLLRQREVDLSESLIFGLAGGLSFIYWRTKQMPTPFVGGRIKPDTLSENLANALKLRLSVHETSSVKRAKEHLLAELESGTVVGLKLDRYFLDYSTDDFRFAAHYVACVGHDDDRFALVETQPLGLQWASAESLETARNARGPMSSRNRAFTLDLAKGGLPDLGKAARKGIKKAAEEFLNPPISNFGYKGMHKVADLMPQWLDDLESPADSLPEICTIMEDAGTGGGLFRTMWAEFLAETADITGTGAYQEVSDAYREVSKKWTEVAGLLNEAGVASSRESLHSASKLVHEAADKEQLLMQRLLELSS
ncbi:Butirosin biosynthesis protein H, N-terminal [Streptomyces sp. Ag82_O1-12]|uniref:BtrH N-terminal domain-containing protein n=1 Tax=unclassified Streptomyces TaxID=2593676 RepID=UPI000BC8D4E2|nr:MULTISPECIES: BtrH N-terminal domain-containing protein [unclassified Streptomyces]SMQ21673.1 Butirosin biosynthesis protein H, N-terminal [Streptomyces sp. Ag82_O1-12]SOD50108.1 Butirosin biosynthesis protein H, N-terminal [Streptomyces sp. Ag82_G6-1]